jgi:hypothetical protein
MLKERKMVYMLKKHSFKCLFTSQWKLKLINQIVDKENFHAYKALKIQQ